jgi:hypothetical protein
MGQRLVNTVWTSTKRTISTSAKQITVSKEGIYFIELIIIIIIIIII